MRWTFRISFFLFLAWAIFMVSPFVALYDLSKAVEAKDVGRITERVNFNALRSSLSRQILGEYLKDQDLQGAELDIATEAGTAVLNPVVEELVSPQALIDLFEKGWPEKATGGRSSSGVSPLSFDFGSLRQAWRTFLFSESQGFRSVTIPIPIESPKDQQFRITMRLRNTTWRLSGLELPVALREELIKRAAVASRYAQPSSGHQKTRL
ncbi:DUF2939 domain-containing protein [Microvirga sp. ACRRW]|uniref:DUF2939 domain-containing protein n=1 Tax=Microvirga sp. ACRRW TaxID=2918205 RepID=UPI001EF61369|nr:DUF2939 domain-containing protein [Microvirga sp. ACRRW]MCG7392543.1 DUF2939 domain-containing protein [Microvirga sp. ACRRW]